MMNYGDWRYKEVSLTPGETATGKHKAEGSLSKGAGEECPEAFTNEIRHRGINERMAC
jgi:hypothetical protein